MDKEKEIIKEDVRDLEYLVQKYREEGKMQKAADIEVEIDSLKAKLLATR